MGTQLAEEQIDILKLLNCLDEFVSLEDEEPKKIDKLHEEAMSSYTMDSDLVDEIVEELIHFGYVDNELNITMNGRQYLRLYSNKNGNSEMSNIFAENVTFIEKQENIEKVEYTENHKPLSTVNLNATAKGISILEK